ncbi:MAG: SAM-dependent methyltransferase [Planctomycetota bacterium]|jgi:hypothetical protein
MSVWRTRLAVGLTAGAVIALELALVRVLSLRFWHHFATMAISVALLGFGASGTMMTLCRRRILAAPRAWLSAAALGFALSIPACLHLSRFVSLDVQFLAWDPSQLVGVLLLEATLFVPFVFAATVIGVALMDEPKAIPGHYAVNLIGSGVGAVAAVAAMAFLSTSQLLTASAGTAYLAAAALIPWRRAGPALGGGAVGVVLIALAVCTPYRPTVSAYKSLAVYEAMAGTRTLHSAEGPFGRIDVIKGDAIHHSPPLSLAYEGGVPDHVVVLADGDEAGAVYRCPTVSQWRFTDYTTAAAAFRLRQKPSVLVIGSGGGDGVGLALLHGSPSVTALEMNRQMSDVIVGRLAELGGDVYRKPGVRLVNEEARAFLASTGQSFDLIQLPITGAGSASGAGLYAAQESYLYTVESLGAMSDRLTDRGVLTLTFWTKTPPRDGLRIFDTAAQMLRSRDVEPAKHLAMIRGWATVTVLVAKRPWEDGDLRALRAFCRERSFDVCYVPGIQPAEANRFHVLDRPYYFEAAGELLGPGREAFLSKYAFNVAAATDDRPYFFHFFRWGGWRGLSQQLGRQGRAHLEMGSLLLAGALLQSALLAAVLIILPLVPAIRRGRFAGGGVFVLGFFLSIGAGFMLLEIAFLQKLILYLAHPIYAAAAAIAGFLVFAGAGSALSNRWPGGPKRIIAVAAVAVVGIGLVYSWGLGRWLAMTQSWPMPARLAVAALTIAPLAVAMGHLFPSALRLIRASRPQLVPWAWAVNGYASVVATVATPLLAMSVGFTVTSVIAVLAYALAGAAGLCLPRGNG